MGPHRKRRQQNRKHPSLPINLLCRASLACRMCKTWCRGIKKKRDMRHEERYRNRVGETKHQCPSAQSTQYAAPTSSVPSATQSLHVRWDKEGALSYKVTSDVRVTRTELGIQLCHACQKHPMQRCRKCDRPRKHTELSQTSTEH